MAKGKDGVRVAGDGRRRRGRVPRQGDRGGAGQATFDAAALDGVTVPSGSLMSDMHASADYRANLIVVMAKRAVAKANG